MSEQFSILIDSRTRFETGEPGGVWLSMPTTKEQLHEAMQRVGITADNPQDFLINGFMNTEQQPFDVPLPVIQSAGLDELNYLGNLLSMQRDEDRNKFTAAVTLGERAGNIKDLINLAQNLDCYWLYPTVQKRKSISCMRNTGGTQLSTMGDALPTRAISTTTRTPLRSGTTARKATYRGNIRL